VAAPQSPEVDVVTAAAELTALGRKAATAYDRPDLVTRLAAAERRLRDPDVRVLVVGEFKQGKSSLVNGLVLDAVCPVDDDIATSVPTVVRFGDSRSAVAVWHTEDGTEIDAAREQIELEAVPDFVSEAGNSGNERGLNSVEVTVPSPILQSGLVLVDTPGVGGLGSPHTAITVGALPLADAVIFVSDASQEYTAPELSFLTTARELCPNLLCVLTKTDFYPYWRRILELDAAHLRRAGVSADIIAVSSALRRRAAQQQSQELNAESGYPRLVSYLREQVVGRAQVLAARAAVADLAFVTRQLDNHFETERRALADPERADRLLRELERAKEQATQLRSTVSRWQLTLNDGIADLGSAVDFDLRSRLRNFGREVDDTLDQVDPGEVWDEFEAWLRQSVTAHVAANYAELKRLADELAARVEEHFSGDARAVSELLRVAAPIDAVDTVAITSPDMGAKFGAGKQVMHGLRTSYGSFIMFSFLTNLVGLGGALVNPLFAVAGLVMGRGAVRTEKQRQLSIRQGQAKNMCRRYIDDVLFQVGTDSRNTLRRIQRELRDVFAARAEELQTSAQESLATAQAAVQADQQTRTKRLRAVEAELKRIRALHQRVTHLAARVGLDAGQEP
jgi:hypothetical protein